MKVDSTSAARRASPLDTMCMAALPDGSLATISRAGVVTLAPAIDAAGHALTKPAKNPLDTARMSVDTSPDGSLIAWSMKDLAVCSTKTRKVVHKLKGRCPAFSRDGSTIAYASIRSIRVANAADGSSDREIAEGWDRGQMAAAVEDLAFSPDGTQLAVSGEYGQVRFFDMKEDAVRSCEALIAQPAGPVASLAWSPGGRLAGGELGRRIGVRAPGASPLVLDVARWLEGEMSPDAATSVKVVAVGISPDGSLVLSACVAGNKIPGKASWASLWRAEDGEELAHLVFESGVARCVAFTPDGKHALIGCSDAPYAPPNAQDGVWSWGV